MANERWMTVNEVAAEFRMSSQTIRTWIANGQFQSARKFGRKWLISREDVLAMASRS